MMTMTVERTCSYRKFHPERVGRRFRFDPKTGHSNADVRFRVDFVCFAPKNGPSSGGSLESGFDPNRSFPLCR